jgi:hypothetical protein
MDANSTSFTSPLAIPQISNVNIPLHLEYVVDAISNASLWTVLWTVLAVAVVYDQSMFYPRSVASGRGVHVVGKSQENKYMWAGEGMGANGHHKTRGSRTEFGS